MRFVDFKTPIAHHPTVSTEWFEPGHAYGNTETFTITTCFPANTPPEVHADSSGEALPGVTLKIVDPLTRSGCSARRARRDLRQGTDAHAGLYRHAVG